MSAARETLTSNVRPMRRADIVTIDTIEKETYPFPWSMNIFRDCLQTGYVCRVLDTAQGLAGYAIISVGAGEAHILNLCIRRERRREGLGTLFLDRLMSEISALGVKRVILEVRPSNEAAQRLYEQAGFSRIGTRRGYYPAANGREDALVLARPLTTEPLPG